MKAIASVINREFDFIGFIVKGKTEEIGNNKGIRFFTIDELRNVVRRDMARGIKNNVLNRAYENLRTMEVILKDGGKFQPFGCNITLKTRIEVQGKLVGFDIIIDNKIEKRCSYEHVIKLVRIGNVEGFTVGVAPDGKEIIRGLKGYSINNIPQIIINKEEKPEKPAKTEKAEKMEVKEVSRVKEGEKAGLIELLEYLNNEEARVVFIREDNVYKVNNFSLSGHTVNDKFKSSRIELMESRPEYNSTNLNINLKFKKFGRVEVPTVEGKTRKLSTYTHSRKSVIKNGNVNVEHLILGVKKQKLDEFNQYIREKFGRTGIKLEILKDDNSYLKTIIKNYKSANNYVWFLIKRGEMKRLLHLSAENDEGHCVLNNEELYKIISELENVKLTLKGIKNLIKQTEPELVNKQIDKGAAMFIQEEMMADNTQLTFKQCCDILEEIGIDIYTGAFIKVEPLAINEDNLGNIRSKLDDIVKETEELENNPDWPNGFSIDYSTTEGPGVPLNYNVDELYNEQKRLNERVRILGISIFKHNYAVLLRGKGKLGLSEVKEWEPVKTKSKKSILYKKRVGDGYLIVTLKNVEIL